MNPEREKNEIATEALAAVNRGLRNRLNVEHRLIGAPLPGDERGHRRTVSANPPSVRALPQP